MPRLEEKFSVTLAVWVPGIPWMLTVIVIGPNGVTGQLPLMVNFAPWSAQCEKLNSVRP